MKFYRFCRFVFSPLVRLLWPTKIYGMENMPKGKAIILANHYSALEIPVVAVRLFKKDLHALSKKELYKYRLFAWILRKFGGIPVDRENVDPSTIKEILKVLGAGKQLYMCPEGTRNKSESKEMLPLKHGAAIFAMKTKTNLVPIVFYKKTKFFKRNYLMIGKPFDLSSFYGDRSPEAKDKATLVIQEKFAEVRRDLDEIVENKKGKKK